jgi:2-keto-4-pentenoate hydratase
MEGSGVMSRTDATSVLQGHADALAGAYGGGAMPPIRHALGDTATVDDAYAIQALNTERWLSEGRVVVGAKTGLTAKAVQAQLGVDQPDFGILFADMAVEDGAAVAPGRLLQPKVEAEIAFVMRRAPDIARLTAAELLSSIDYALPALEIVDSRITGWDIGIIDTIADNASSGLFVLGTTPVPITGIDLRLCGMVLEKNGEPVSFGAGAACLGHPLHALGWLARTLAKVGRPLEAGSIVLSGALGPMVDARPGDVFETRIEGVGSARVRFGQ